MNIEQLAIEHGAVHYSPPPMRAVKGLSFTFEQLEAFAKALQSSEPVAMPTFNKISKNIDDSRFVGHPKQSALDTNNVKTGARIMYDAIYVWLKKQNTPSTVSVEKRIAELQAENKLLNDAITEDKILVAYAKQLEATNKKLLDAISLTVEENGYLADGDNCTLRHLVKAIAEAEGK